MGNSATTPSDLGWDDSLYEGRPEGEPGPSAADTAAKASPRSGDGDDGDGGLMDGTARADAGADGPAGASDGAGGSGGSAGSAGSRAPGGGRRRAVRWVAGSVALLVLGTAGAAWAYYEHLNANIKKDELNLGDGKLSKPAANADGQTPINILLLGSDSRNSAENVKLGGARDNVGDKPRADVEMLVHLSADRSNMTVISIPRDTRVTIPKCTDPHDGTVYPQTHDIINESLAHGGPGCTVATWEELTGIPIDHFMMVDFAGVVKMADAVGGVPVCVDKNVWDRKSGLKLKAGTTVVQNVQALQWLRTRHGFEDGSDLGRTHAQHLYMNSMIRELKKSAKLTDPGQLTSLAEAATKSITVDTGLGTVKKLYDLANELKQVPTERITMTTMPWIPDPRNGDHVIPAPGDADKLFALVRGDTPVDGKAKKPAASASPTPSDTAAPKGEISVTVRNGTGTAVDGPVRGRATELAGQLNGLGFTKAAADSTPEAQADTTISYPRADLKADAQSVAKALGLPDSAVRMSKSVTEVTLVIGADWREGTAYPKAAATGADKAPDSSAALNAADTTACMKVNTYEGSRYTW